MKFAILSLLPLLAAATAIGERDADEASMKGVAPNNAPQDDNSLSGLMTASYGVDYSDNSQMGAETMLGAESRDSPGWRGVALQNSVGTGAPALYDRRYDPGANNEADKTRLRLSSSVNRSIYLESFMVIQNNMFESGKCVMGIADADWTVMCESRRRRYEEGLTLAEGQHGRVRQDAKDLDEATKVAIMLAEVLKQRAERKAKEARSSCS
ncbi:hypothetical protein ARSEF1564_008981 [Beauveria bassiana]